MVQQNTTFFSADAPVLRYLDCKFRKEQIGAGGADGEEHDFNRKEKILAERVKDSPDLTVSALFAMNHKQGSVWVGTGRSVYLLSNVFKVLNRNAVEGKERFHNLPNFWS